MKDLEVTVYIENIQKIKERLKEYEMFFNNIKDNIDSENSLLDEINTQNQQMINLIRELEEKIDLHREQYHEFETESEKYNLKISLNEEKSNNFLKNILRIDSELADINEKMKSYDGEQEKNKNKINYFNEQYELNYSELSKLEKEYRLLLKVIGESEAYIESLNSGIMEKLDALGDKKICYFNTKTFIDNTLKRQAIIKEDMYQLRLDLDKEKKQEEELLKILNDAKCAIEKAKNVQAVLNKNKENSENLLDQNRMKLNRVKSDIQLKTSRYKMLYSMEETLEGYSKSVKNLLSHCQKSPEFCDGLHGVLAQLIKVPKQYEQAYEMTLGGALQNIITSHEYEAKRAIEYLKQNKLGRATFLPISSVKGKGFEKTLANQIKEEKGFIGFSSEIITYDSQYLGIILKPSWQGCNS